MNHQLLELLVCPKSKKKLEMAPPQTIETLNAQIKARKCHTLGGDLVEEPVEEALIQPGEKLLYLVRNNIPVMIYEQAINTSNL